LVAPLSSTSTFTYLMPWRDNAFTCVTFTASLLAHAHSERACRVTTSSPSSSNRSSEAFWPPSRFDARNHDLGDAVRERGPQLRHRVATCGTEEIDELPEAAHRRRLQRSPVDDPYQPENPSLAGWDRRRFEFCPDLDSRNNQCRGHERLLCSKSVLL